ncbi:hypothetical protein SAMN05660653_02969 [Desulfonatronum thiosulfatophilum]|uniref:Uncharacterized protein n=1 Tax=Desulfonatronum thiosulfatophilum TaxID=617002 RepID=A0A1G6EN05_9BACT|nr:hypothetical protein SAMN05660653_02969 [Desulfonatronum thiosulfatophilum]
MDETVITFDDWEKVLKTSAPPERYHAYRLSGSHRQIPLLASGTDNIPDIEVFKRHLEWKQSYLAPDRYAFGCFRGVWVGPS